MTVRCRHCKATDSVASYDRYLATCSGDVLVSGHTPYTLEFEPGGYTEISWDSCEQLGWECMSCFQTVLTQEGEDDGASLRRLVEVVA